MPMEKLARLWPEWKIEKQIGRGTFGSVYQAVRQNGGLTGRAAIKVISIPQSEYELETLRADGMDSQQIRTYLKRIVDDFANEIRVMKNFRGRPNIVSIDEAVVSEKTDGLGWDIFIRMELLTPFTAYISDKKLDEAEVIRLGCDICTALEQCSRRSIIHRDIKPENIFVDSFGSFKLGDFGTARQMEGLTSGFSQKGTFNYMAPEVVNGTGYDARVDLYSLGLVLYRLMNGNRLPFVSKKQLLSPSERRNALDRRIRGDALPPPEEASPALAQVILHACAYRREDRFEDAKQMRLALLSCAAGETPQLPFAQEEPELQISQTMTLQSEQETQPPVTPGRKRKLTAWLAALALLAGSCLGFYYLGGALGERSDNRELQAAETTVAAETTAAPTEQTQQATEETRPAGFEPCEVAVLSLPDKQEYTLNEVIDVYGLTLQVTGSDGTEKTVRSGFFYWPKIVTETGITQVRVVYQGMETTFPIHVAEGNGELSVETMPDKQIYQMGEALDTQGLTLRVRHADGTEEIITEGFTCSPERITSSGYQTVTVTYEGMITRFMVSSYYSDGYSDWDAYYQEVENDMDDFTFENVKLEPYLNYHESSGTGVNQDGTPVTWMARVTFDLTQDQFWSLNRTNDIEVHCSWDYSRSFIHPIGGSFTSAKLGVTAVSYDAIPASESESGRDQYAFDIQLPDDAKIAGSRWVKVCVGEHQMTVNFQLEYLGDYETGLGWAITDIEYEA